MNNKISAILVAIYLMAGCSSGGGTSGAGGEGATTAGTLLLTATLSTGDSISHDTHFNLCFDSMGVPSGEEPGLTSKTGALTITLTNIADLTGGIFPIGVILESYRVTFSPQGGGAPGLTARSYGQTSSILSSSASATISVVLLDLGFTIPEFQARNPAGVVYSYRITVTVTGRTLSGDRVNLSAATFLEIGNFDRCT